MRRRSWVVIGVATVLVAAVVGAYWYARPLLRTGTGYAAHNACALTHVAHRGTPTADLPPNPLVPVLRISTSRAGAQASVLGLLARQHAWYTGGFGCTLGPEAPELPFATSVDPARNPYASLPAPTAPAEVEAALDLAFGTELPTAERTVLGTRAIVVLHDGELVAERYAEGFDATTPQLGWSMTKSVTNLLVGRLVQRGEVALEDDHLRPEWTDERADITIEDLLSMRSGLTWDETYDLGTTITQMLYAEPDMGAFAASQPLAHAPGTVQQYSSGSTTLLCSVLAPERGGADWPRTELLAPLGLASMVIEPDGAGTPVCGSYGWATPREWASLGQLALDDGVWDGERLLPEGWIARSTTAVGGEEDGYGLGWWVNTRVDGTLVEPGLPADTYWASGHDGQWLVVVPSADLVVARLGFGPEADDTRKAPVVAALIAALPS